MFENRTPPEVIQMAKEHSIKMVDLKFTDVPGALQHMTLPIGQLDESLFSSGIGFDGSSIRGFQAIHESDMLLVADSSSAAIDPVYSVPTLSLLCNITDPITGSDYTRDARHIAQKAEAYLKSTGLVT